MNFKPEAGRPNVRNNTASYYLKNPALEVDRAASSKEDDNSEEEKEEMDSNYAIKR